MIELTKEDKISGEIEVDESYFAAKRVSGKRGREQLVNSGICGIKHDRCLRRNYYQ
ncbi:transposase [Rickettsiales endosymbiont of Stachyamoeba lipophora]|uniref:transposase n=1 Tax=Rickettsiales endosymbiont of Stachyamoeba lipophora TaxID=2486578 RepID=UPI0013DD8F26|nr:transposase [Rickettsiales endosymbiont of Stachyamoeba lipophora]